jgi:hypothetical protein
VRRDPAENTSIIYRIMANEWQTRTKLEEYSPRIETYVQYDKPGASLGDYAAGDSYFLGRLKFGAGRFKMSTQAVESPLLPDSRFGRRMRLAGLIGLRLRMDEFAVQSLVVDESNFDREHYRFEAVRWEYLGDVRCLAVDVHPRNPENVGAFEGRIWVEGQNYAIVRLNGRRINPPHRDLYVHFDSWRENLEPGLWLPAYVFSQDTDLHKRLKFRAETRLWGYDLTARHEQQEWTSVTVEAPTPFRDSSEQGFDMSPVEAERQLTVDAERNVLERLEKARLIAPPGPVDQVLATVVNNLRVTNHLEGMPPIQCRIMLTSSLESFSLAYTIVLSRGLIDVLPDEASLAMVLAHEVAHIALGHQMDTRFAFNDQTHLTDEELLSKLDIARLPKQEAAADAKGIEYLQNSPYKDNLSQAGLFLRGAAAAAPHVPHLFGPHLGNGMTERKKSVRMAALIGGSPALNPKNVSQIAALPLGSRVQVNAFDGAVVFASRKAVPLMNPNEKMPFRVTRLIPYLKPYDASPTVADVRK